MTGRRQVKTTCKHGHELTPKNVYVDPRGSRQCRECRNIVIRKWRRTAQLTEAGARRLIAGLREGKTIKNLVYGKIGRQPAAPELRVVSSSMVFRNTLAANPKFAKIVKSLAQKNAQAARAEGFRKQRIVAAPALMRGDGRSAFETVQNATRHLHEPLRGVVQSDMFLALAEGGLKLPDVQRRTPEFVRKYYRAEQHAVDSRYGHRSIYAPIGEDGFTLMDVIADRGEWSPVAISTGRML